MKTAIAFFLCLAACARLSFAADTVITRETISSKNGIVLQGTDRLVTPGSFKPPVEITIVAKTDSTNLRIGYAADQVIFNWEAGREELRVDGGPANGLHKAGAGSIPVREYVVIKWWVTPTGQSISVNNKVRFTHEGDYSKIDRPVSIFPGAGSFVTVKSVQVKPLK